MKNLFFPLQYKYGSIYDAKDNLLIKAHREFDNPLAATDRDELLKFITKLLNKNKGKLCAL